MTEIVVKRPGEAKLKDLFKPGTVGKYTVKNRALGINSSTGQTVVATGFTPRQTFTVN